MAQQTSSSWYSPHWHHNRFPQLAVVTGFTSAKLAFGSSFLNNTNGLNCDPSAWGFKRLRAPANAEELLSQQDLELLSCPTCLYKFFHFHKEQCSFVGKLVFHRVRTWVNRLIRLLKLFPRIVVLGAPTSESMNRFLRQTATWCHKTLCRAVPYLDCLVARWDCCYLHCHRNGI